VSTLQIRNLPEDLHAQLSERSAKLHMSMSEYVTKLLRDDMSRPLFNEWAATIRSEGPGRSIDVVGALDAVRDEYDAGEK